MPELPEVETICGRLRAGEVGTPPLVGRRVRAVRVLWAGCIAAPGPQRFRQRLRGQTVRRIARRGKFLVLHLSRDTLLVHLRMSGSLRLERRASSTQARDERPASRHDRLVLELEDDWRLAFHDPRKFGRLWLTRDPAALLASLGPEPLAPAFTADALRARLRGRRRQIKPLLLDQTFLAGLGNIYTDEALHRAGIHPLTRADCLTPAAVHRLWRSIRAVLRAAIRCQGTTFDQVYGGGNFRRRLHVYQRTGRPCRSCGTPIRRMLVGQRGSHFCPLCQRRGRRSHR